MPVNDILSGLAGAVGPAGAEGSAAKLAMELLSDYAPVRQDALGNVICELGDNSAQEHILLDAHIDEIGLVVTRVDDKGFLHIDKVGGADRRTLMDAEVWVFGTKRLPGVVCCMPPHLTSGDRTAVPDFDKLHIDIGYGAEKAKELVPLGSRVVVRSKPVGLLGNRVSCKALDNRAGAAALIRTVELLREPGARLNCRVTVLLSTMEEVGGGGAKAGAFGIEPTQAIVVDAGFATQPGVPIEKAKELGKGPMIGCAPSLDYDITLALRRMADEKDIPWQHDIMGGSTGTNADWIAVSRGGVRCGLVSIPDRSMHTAAEVMDIDDIENTAKLLAEYVLSVGGEGTAARERRDMYAE